MVPERIALLLFVLLTTLRARSNGDKITVSEQKETRNEGSCVTIPCKYQKQGEELTLLWFKDAIYDTNKLAFNGIIVYSNNNKRPQSLDYSSRVEYITDQTSNVIKCDLRISDLQKTDSGNYSFRFIGKEQNKFMSKAMNLTVTDNPCKVHIDPSDLKNPLIEFDEFTIHCSTSGLCDSYPEWLVQTSGQKQEWMSSSSIDMFTVTQENKEGRKVTKLELKLTWKDDNRILSCRPAKSKDPCQFRNITLSVEYAPKETKATVSSENVNEGDSVTLSCTSRGHPDVTFTWFKREEIQTPQETTLQLRRVQPADSGEYYCEAKNKYETMKSNIIKIDVKYGPKGVTVQPPSNINDLKEGDELTLKCSVEKSNPAVKWFTWYKNSQEQSENSETLIISKVTADDKGDYECQAENGEKKSKSDKLPVSLKYSPRSIKIEGSTTVKVGTGLKLTCSADANPEPLLYKWKFQSQLIWTSKINQLNIENVTIQQAGSYTCAVNNTVGTTSGSTNVDVVYPPFNLKLIMKQELREFEIICITCTVQSFPASELTVTGPQEDLKYILDNRGNRTESANKLTVYLNVTMSDAGIYKCEAGNSEGKQEIKQELIVQYAPKNVTAGSKGEETFGKELTLTCEAHSNPALASYEWTKHADGHVKTAGHGQKLYFHSLEVSDSGQYVCIAINSIGRTKSQSVDIRVKYAPRINIVHNMTDLALWEFPVYLTCSADAYPLATSYTWYRQEDNTTVLSHQQNFTVFPQNPGVYYCNAENQIGKTQSKQIMVFVSSKFKIFYQIILPIILLLLLIVVAIFLIRRTIIKARSDQQTGANYTFFPVFLLRSSTVANLLLLGSQNNNQENPSVEDPGVRRVNAPHPTPHPSQTQDFNPRPKPSIHTVYSAIKFPQMKQERDSPKQPRTANMNDDLTSSTLNYVTLDFKWQKEPARRETESSAVYAMVSKKVKNSQSEHDYENVSSACAPKMSLPNMDWESDTSEEDEVNYTAVSCSAKEPQKTPKSRFSSSSSDEEDRTVYSAIKK